MPVKMTPLTPVGDLAFLVGDPRRAFTLAQELMVQPKMSHMARGLWGYSGESLDGLSLTVQATGSGGPSAVPVIGDLAERGAKVMVRLGTCLAIAQEIEAGTPILVEQAIPNDGVSARLGHGGPSAPDDSLFKALLGLGRVGVVSSHDLVERFEPKGELRADPSPAAVRDLQTAATFAMCQELGVPAVALLIVVEDQSGRRLSEEELGEIFKVSGREVLGRLTPSEKLDPKPPL